MGATESQGPEVADEIVLRTHTRFSIEPHWTDVGLRGSVRVHCEREEDLYGLSKARHRRFRRSHAEMVLISHLVTPPSASVRATLTNPYASMDIADVVKVPTAGGLLFFVKRIPGTLNQWQRAPPIRAYEACTERCLMANGREGRDHRGTSFAQRGLFLRPQKEPFIPDESWKQVPTGVHRLSRWEASSFNIDRMIAPDILGLLDSVVRRSH